MSSATPPPTPATESRLRSTLRLSKLLLPALLVCTASAALAWRAAAPSAPHPRGAEVSAQGTQERVETEIVVLRPSGFQPAAITRPAGPFVLGVDNRSGSGDITLVLERDGGGRVPALRERRRSASWRDIVDLPPGRYVLSAEGRPAWRCEVTITPR